MSKSATKPAQPSKPGQRPAAAPRRRWPRRLAIATLVGFTLYTLFGFFGVPLLIRHVAIPQLNKRLSGSASLAKAYTNPFRLSMRLEGFNVLDAAGQRVLGFDALEGNLQLVDSLFKGGTHLLRAAVDRPFVSARLEKDGSLNLAALLKPSPAPASSAQAPAPAPGFKTIPRLVVGSLKVDAAELHLADTRPSQAFEKIVEGLTFELTGLDTRPDHDSPATLAARTTDGERLTWTGTLRADPISSKGTLEITDVALPKLMPYARERTEGAIAAGTLSTTIHYDFAPVRSPRVVSATLPQLTLKDLRIEQPDGPTLELPALTAAAASIDAAARTAHLDKLTVDSPVIHVRRDAAGVISLARLAPEAGDAPAAAQGRTPPTPDAAVPAVDPTTIEYPVEQVRVALLQLAEHVLTGWTVSLGALEVSGGAVNILDQAPRAPVELNLRDLALAAGPVSSAEHFRTPLSLSFTLAQGGAADLKLDVDPLTPAIAGPVTLTDISLAPFAPYLPESAGDAAPSIALAAGTLSVKGNLTSARDENRAFTGAWKGAASLASIQVNSAGPDPALTLAQLQTDGSLDVGFLPGNQPRAAWEGVVRLQSLSARSPLLGSSALELAALETQGKLTVTPADTFPALAYDGTTTVQGARYQGAPMGPVDAALGRIEANGSAAFSGTATYRGSLTLRDIAITAPDLFSLDAAVQSLELAGLTLDQAANSVELDRLAITAPHIKAALALLPDAPSTPPDSSDTASPAAGRFTPPNIPLSARIAELSISSGVLEIRDPAGSDAPPLTVSDLEVNAQSLSTRPGSRSTVRMTSRVAGTGKVEFEGALDPLELPRESDLTLRVAAVPLKPFDPFAGRYVGYLVESGRATLDIPLTIRAGKVEGDMNFALDNMHLGQKVDSPDAPDVPIKLGLDLLRDSNDRVEGQIGLSGDMNDPAFSFGGLIWKAFMNVFVGAATAPFKILGGIIGLAEGQDLSMVEFPPGSAELSPDALSTLDAMAAALAKREKLRLAVVGRAAPQDEPALKLAALRAGLGLPKSTIPQPEDAPPPADPAYRNALEDAYREAFGREAIVSSRQSIPDENKRFSDYEHKLAERQTLAPNALEELAAARAAAVVEALVEGSGVSADRVTTAPPSDDKPAEKPSAEFTIN
ncbi:MAG: DUF748 domain-containing protein [Planctomycetota bacterium]|nr:DUF748 domain-containing protein [Planctomycetota bacterium]